MPSHDKLSDECHSIRKSCYDVLVNCQLKQTTATFYWDDSDNIVGCSPMGALFLGLEMPHELFHDKEYLEDEFRTDIDDLESSIKDGLTFEQIAYKHFARESNM